MTALTAARKRTSKDARILNAPVKAGAQIWQNGLVALKAGVAAAALVATSRADLDATRVIGIAAASATGGAGDGDVRVDIDRGEAIAFANSGGGDAITLADVGNPAFVVDDQTVARTIGNGNRPIAGEIVDVDSEGVWVAVGRNTAPRRLRIPFEIPQTELLAPTSIELVSPVAGAITRAEGIVQTAITTGGDVTFLVGATPVDGLTLTFADGAAKGTVVSDEPTHAHASTVVAAGGRIQVSPSAAFATAGAVRGYVEISF